IDGPELDGIVLATPQQLGNMLGRILASDVLLVELHLGHDLFRRRHIGHVELMLVALLRYLERRGKIENRPTVLDRHYTARGKAATVAHSLDIVDDGRFCIAGTDEVRLQRMC